MLFENSRLADWGREIHIGRVLVVEFDPFQGRLIRCGVVHDLVHDHGAICLQVNRSVESQNEEEEQQSVFGRKDSVR